MDTPFNMVDCIEETGKVLNLNNQDIVKYLCGIEEERNNLDMIVRKQYEERNQIESEIQTLTYKLCLINKSMAMRIKTKNNYDKTIQEIKAHYEELVESSNKLKQIVEKTQVDLDSIMNKKVGTAADIAPNGPDNRPCYASEEPTKDESSSDDSPKWSNIRMSQEKSETPNNKDGRPMTNNGMKEVEEKTVSYDNANDNKALGSAEQGISEGISHGSVEKAAGSISIDETFLSQEREVHNVEASTSDLHPDPASEEKYKSDSLSKL